MTENTFLEHLHRLCGVFDRLREANLKLKPAKCAYCKSEVAFLGHIVSANGVIIDPAKVEKMKNWPLPPSKREVQQFLGLANYYRRFIQDHCQITAQVDRENSEVPLDSAMSASI